MDIDYDGFKKTRWPAILKMDIDYDGFKKTRWPAILKMDTHYDGFKKTVFEKTRTKGSDDGLLSNIRQ